MLDSGHSRASSRRLLSNGVVMISCATTRSVRLALYSQIMPNRDIPEETAPPCTGAKHRLRAPDRRRRMAGVGLP